MCLSSTLAHLAERPTRMYTLESILKDMYHADECTLLDGEKTASVQPSFGVKQRCPLSLLLFTIYLNGIDSVVDGGKGALTDTSNFLVTHMLFADDLSFMSNDPNHMQTMLDKQSVHTKKVSHCQYTEV